jgi:small-conductance mechanosensitive channel
MLTYSTRSEAWLTWAIGLSLSFPFCMLLLTEIIERLKQSRPGLANTLRIIRQAVLPILMLLLLLIKVVGIDLNQPVLRIISTILWLGIIVASLSGVNAIVFEEAPADSWQAKVPSLLVDLCRTLLVVFGLAIILAQVWGADLGGVLAALGVGSLVIGLALQDSMGNLFSGIALLFERPFAVGDWIKLGDKTGKVIEITWRSVHIQTRQRQLIIVPNSALAKDSFSNYSRPTKIHGEDFIMGFSYDDPPNHVMDILREVTATTEGVLSDPAPIIQIVSYDAYSIGYLIRFFVVDYEGLPRIRGALLSRLWYVSNRHGLTIPFPTAIEYKVQEKPAKNNPENEDIILILRSLPGFNNMSQSLLKKVADQARYSQYGRGEWVIRQDDTLPGLHLILRGKATVQHSVKAESPQEIAHLVTGDIFGEKLLMGQVKSDVSVLAQRDLDILILDIELFHHVLEQTPMLAAAIAETMEARRRSNFNP